MGLERSARGGLRGRPGRRQRAVVAAEGRVRRARRGGPQGKYLQRPDGSKSESFRGVVCPTRGPSLRIVPFPETLFTVAPPSGTPLIPPRRFLLRRPSPRCAPRGRARALAVLLRGLAGRRRRAGSSRACGRRGPSSSSSVQPAAARLPGAPSRQRSPRLAALLPLGQRVCPSRPFRRCSSGHEGSRRAAGAAGERLSAFHSCCYIW
jgi:hypothetical protein